MTQSPGPLVCGPSVTPPLPSPVTYRQESELVSSIASSWYFQLLGWVLYAHTNVGDLQGTSSPPQYLPMGWVASLLSLALSPTGGFSVISPQTAGVLKSGTASRAAGVGARDSGLGGGRNRVWSSHNAYFGLTSALRCQIPKVTGHGPSFIHSFTHST